jgi:hypothetical protein
MDSLEQRLQRLEDIESIKQLKARYCDACDGGWSKERPGHDWDKLQHMFTEDGVWDGTPISMRAVGHEQLRKMYTDLKKEVPFASHNITNPQIEIEGDRATAKWHLLAMLTLPHPVASVPPAGAFCIIFYDDICVRTKTGWKFKEMKLSYATFTNVEKGWAKERMMDLKFWAEAVQR